MSSPPQQEQSKIETVFTGAMHCDQGHLHSCSSQEGLPAGLSSYLEVTDSGCGMDENACARLFEPFFTTKFAGRGLGMSAVLGIVRGHLGAIRVDSEVSNGS